MKVLVIQTYLKDNIIRNHQHTYKPLPKLEAMSRKQFKRYANMIGADYEFFNEPAPWDKDMPGAHWQRWVMLDRPEYDCIVYADCDILINPRVFSMKHNILDWPGIASRVSHPAAVNKIGWEGGVNCGVMKLTRDECSILKDKIHNYYHPQINQPAFNNCYRDTFGMFKQYLDHRWNRTHQRGYQPFFEHYVGYKKNKQWLNNCKLYGYWK